MKSWQKRSESALWELREVPGGWEPPGRVCPRETAAAVRAGARSTGLSTGLHGGRPSHSRPGLRTASTPCAGGGRPTCSPNLSSSRTVCRAPGGAKATKRPQAPGSGEDGCRGLRMRPDTREGPTPAPRGLPRWGAKAGALLHTARPSAESVP